MLRNFLRKFSDFKTLRSLNKEMRFEEVKQIYEEMKFADDLEKKKCKEQYLYALKYTSLLTDQDSASKIANSEQIYIKENSDPKYIRRIWTDNLYYACITIVAVLYISSKKKGKGSDQIFSLLNSESHIRHAENSHVTFEDVKGIDDCREEIEDIVSYLKNPRKYIEAGAKMTKGVLLTGKPGTGKTLLAKAIAGEAGVKFFFCSGSEFEEVFTGLGAKRIRSLFKKARKNSPCVIFIDEIDGIAGNRNNLSNSSTKQSLNQLLIELDGFKANDQVVVIAATNFPESLDKAVRRSGRFDKEITIPVPDLKGRKEILDLYLSRIKHDESINSADIAKKTTGMTGADLANIVNLAALESVKNNKKVSTLEDFEHAIDRIKIGLAIKTYSMTEDEKMNTIYHELGHAIVGYLTKGAGDIHKVTILPRGQSLGHTSIIDAKENKHRTKEELLAHIDVCMGGRAAEEIFFGIENVSSGASSDLNNATQASYYALKTGLFADVAGFTSYNDITELGYEQRNHIDRLVASILDSSYNRAKTLIKANREIIEKLAAELKEKETLNKEEFIAIINR